MLGNPLIGNQLILGQIDRLYLDAIAILDSFGDPGRKRRRKALPLRVFQNFGLVFRDDAMNVDIEHLPAVEADKSIVVGR